MEYHPMGMFSLVFLVALIGAVVVAALIVWAVVASSKNMHPAGVSPMQPARETPQEILARRFASGEITAEEYERARDLLGGGGKT
jgi:putative membrane protein